MTEYMYGGGYSSLDPEKYGNFTGYRMNFNNIGTSLDARTANQVKEVSKHLNAGVKTFEVAAHSPEVFDAMPKDQLTEIRRLMALTGSEATIHGPMIEPTGITQQGFQELNRKAAEEQLWKALERSAELTPFEKGKPKGNVVFTMHASTINLPPAEFKMKEGEEEKTKSVLLIDSKGTLHQIKEEPRYFGPENKENVGKEIPFNKDEEIKRINQQTWQKQLTNITWYAERGKEAISRNINVESPEQIKKHPELQDKTTGVAYLKDAYGNLRDLFDFAYRDAKPEEKEMLNEFNSKISPYVKQFEDIQNNPKLITKFAELVEEGVDTLNKIHPNMFQPLREFAIKQTAETISNLAIRSYNEFEKNGKNAPIISIENHPAQQSLLTTGEDLKQVIEAARKKFEEKAIASGISKSEAKKESEKLIGATWDVGHINMLRRYGYTDEDIIKQTKEVAPFVKHVHLSDNFGFEHTELPMGMGNVPIQSIMKILDEAHKKTNGFQGKKIAEALSWWQHFSEQGTQHAIIPTLQAFGSPIYGMANAPYWNQAAGSSAGYFGLPMAYMPEKHFSMYGSGFSGLPQELGGQMPGTNSRFSGTPNT